MSAPMPDRRTIPARPDVAAEHLRGQVEAARFVPGVPHAVTAPTVALRPAPRPDCPIDTELLHGEVFTVYDQDPEGWSWGQAASDGYVGWLPSEALGPPGPAAPTHRVAAQRSFLFPGPSIKLPAGPALPFGARVRATGEAAGAFLPVAGGFLWAGHLVGASVVEADWVDVAERFLGVPYLWGGKSSLGLDCSALVQTALMTCGRDAPRDSDMQEHSLGVAVDPDGPLGRGDLVFWRGHVGLLGAPDRLLHANGHTMTVAWEALGDARTRIAAAGGGPVTSVRRLPAAQ